MLSCVVSGLFEKNVCRTGAGGRVPAVIKVAVVHQRARRIPDMSGVIELGQSRQGSQFAGMRCEFLRSVRVEHLFFFFLFLGGGFTEHCHCH